MAASSASTLEAMDAWSSWAWMSSVDPVRSGRAPEVISSSMAPARACISSILSWARCMDIPALPIESEIPVTASPTLACASAAV